MPLTDFLVTGLFLAEEYAMNAATVGRISTRQTATVIMIFFLRSLFN